jgi:hypothetical protein
MGENVLRRLPAPLYDEKKATIEDPVLREAIDLLEEHALNDRLPWVLPNEIDRTEIDGHIYLNDLVHRVAVVYDVEDGDGCRFLTCMDTSNR